MEYTIVKISNIKRGEYTIRGAAIDNEDEPVENLDVPIIIRVYCVFQNVDRHIQNPLFTFSQIVDDEMLPGNNCSCFPKRGNRVDDEMLPINIYSCLPKRGHVFELKDLQSKFVFRITIIFFY